MRPRPNWLKSLTSQKTERYTAIRCPHPQRGAAGGALPGTARHASPRRAGEAKFPSSIISRVRIRRNFFVGPAPLGCANLFEQPRKKRPASSSMTNSMRAANPVPLDGLALSAATDEREQTVNNCSPRWMLCFQQNKNGDRGWPPPNQPETLDAALLRPGRFDRQCWFDRPISPARKDDSRNLCQEGEAGRRLSISIASPRPPVALRRAIWPTC